MRAASPQAALQLEQPGFEPPQYAFSVTLALPGGIYPDASVAVTSLQIQAATTTDVPDGTRIDEGYPARSASFTLAGSIDPADETKTVGWLFGRYSTSSPLYRQDVFRRLVTIDVNLYPDGAAGTPEVFRQFTGYVDDYTENPDGTVQFDCVDFRSNLRNVTDIAAVVTAAPYNAGLTSEYAVDALLRTSTSGVFSSWPKARPSAVLAVGFRSSLWPEIGVIDTSFLQPAPSFAACVYGTGLVPYNEKKFDVNSGGWPQNVYTTSAGVGQDMFLEHWINGVTAASGAGTVIQILAADESVGVVIRYDRTGITVQAFTAGSTDHGDTWTVGVTPATHYLAVKLHWAYGTATVSGSVQLDGAVHTIASRNVGGAARASGKTFTSVRVSQLSATATTIEALQLSTETAPTPSYPFTPKAVLDPSLNPLQVVPEISGDPWQTIQDIAVAELAWAGFDEAGVFRFANRRTLQDTAIDRTVTSAQSLTSLNVKNSTASVINRAQVGYTTWTTAPAPSNWVYSIDVVTKIPRKQTVTLTPTLDGFVTALDTGVGVYPNSSTATYYSNYRASTDAAGTKEHPGLTFNVSQPGGANKLTIVVTNSSNADAYLVSPANYTDVAVGTPWLNIAGRRVTQNNEMTADVQWPPVTYIWPSKLVGAAGSRFGEVAWTLTGNAWVQDADTANLLASEVVALSAVPLPDVTSVDIMPDPRLQLTDTIHVQDPDVSNVDEYGRIFGVDISYDAGTDFGSEPTYTQSLDIRTLGAPGGWILGVTGRSEIGTGSGTSDSTAYLYAAG